MWYQANYTNLSEPPFLHLSLGDNTINLKTSLQGLSEPMNLQWNFIWSRSFPMTRPQWSHGPEYHHHPLLQTCSERHLSWAVRCQQDRKPLPMSLCRISVLLPAQLRPLYRVTPQCLSMQVIMMYLVSHTATSPMQYHFFKHLPRVFWFFFFKKEKKKKLFSNQVFSHFPLHDLDSVKHLKIMLSGPNRREPNWVGSNSR